MKRGKKRQKKHKLKNKAAYTVAAFFFIFLVCLICYSMLSPSQTEPDDTVEPRAAIVDHLSINQPNQTFWQTSRSLLEAAGFNVVYYGGGVVTVGFYRKLPSLDFDLIIFRVHSTANCTEEYDPGDYVVFFTCEKYSKTKYISEQLAYQLFKVRFPYDRQEYFGITPIFVRDGMRGRFKDTSIIMMGCEGLKYTSIAEAFIDKGAEVYIGWNGPVSASHTDQATMHLLKSLVTKNQTIEQAVTDTMSEVGQDPTYKSIMSFYPANAENNVVSTSAIDVVQTNALIYTNRKKTNPTRVHACATLEKHTEKTRRS